MPDAETTREQQQASWGVAARRWAQSRPWETGTPVNGRLIAMAGIRPGQHVLDLACGAGDQTFDIARVVGPTGYVLGLDITPQMVEGARTRATEQGIENVEFRQIESETDLGVEPESFDAATCRFGLMFMPDPAAALHAVRRALTPGGQMAVSTWGPPDRVPFITVPNRVVARHVEALLPEPGATGVFGLPSEDVLRRVFQEAGFQQFECVSFEWAPMEAETSEEYWELRRQGSGRLASVLSSLPEETRQAIGRDLVQTLRAMFPEGPVTLSSEVLVAAGTA